MTEDDARIWLTQHLAVSRETMDKLGRYVGILQSEMTQQNLIAESTRDQIWARHIVDSAQLLMHGHDASAGPWMDLGAGAGLPGIVIACLNARPMILIESRRKRIDFLSRLKDELGLDHVRVEGRRVEQVEGKAAIISARAFAPLDKLLTISAHLSTPTTLWILPKGRNGQNELEMIRLTWQGVFHVEPSVTSADSSIIVARDVRAKSGKSGRS